MFTLQNTHKDQLSLPGIEARVLPVDSGTSVFDLTFVMEEKDDGLTVTVQYSSCLFRRNTVERLVKNYQQLTRNLLLNPAKPVREVSLMTPEEEREVQSWEGKEVEYPREKSVGEVFEEVVREYGEKVAVVYEGEEVRYEELNRRANQVGRYLRKRGVRRETRVGVCMGRSVELIVVLVGIVKAGGAYVPLDGSNPGERLSYMMKDGGVEVLVVGEEEEGRVEEGEYEKVVWEREREEMEREGVENLEGGGGGGGEELLYIMYTSGSTGEPKGVGVRHQGVVRLVRNSEYVELGSGEVILQYAPVTFDAATFEIWGALLNGGKLKVFPRYRATVEELREWVEKEGVTTLWLTAGLFHQMVEGGEWPRSMRKVRQLLAGGDVLSGKHVRKFLRESEGCRLINGYGPTENTTFSACGQVERVEEGERVPLGRPIGNSQVYVLDEEMRRVGVGEEGELYLGGDGLARGYWERPEQTAERFVPNPYGKRGGERLYRSGDMGRWREDGQLEFGGRKDQQVKLRGYRIELEEIEEVLKKREWVKEAVVVMRGEVEEEKRLVAYVVREGGKVGEVGEGGEGERSGWEELRKYAGERLPEYMVPGQYVELEEMPLTGNGKIDRKRLREGTEEEEGRRQRGGGGEGPRTVTETLLAGIWSEVLQVEGVGVEDDFFQLGGHSLLATQIISRIRDTFGVSLSLRRFFEQADIASVAAIIENEMKMGVPLQAPPLCRRAGQKEAVSFAQQRLWFWCQLEPDTPIYNIPLVLRMKGHLNAPALERAINAIIGRHAVLRTTFSEAAGAPVQIIHESCAVAMRFADLTGVPFDDSREQLNRLVPEETRIPFDLTQGPLLRMLLVTLSAEEYVFVLTMHHVVGDGWSLAVFTRELASIYKAYVSDSAPDLPELPVQYADYAVWQREWFRGEVLESQLAYWRTQLADLPRLALPIAQRQERLPDYTAGEHRFHLGRELTDRLRALSQRENVTLFMTLLGAFQTLLFRYTGQSDFAVGSPIAGRNQRAVEDLIGFFVNTLVLRADLSGNPSFREVLRRVRQRALEAYTNQELPFEKLVEELSPERDLGSSPLFQVYFILQNAPAAAWDLSGLNVNLEELELQNAHFELTLIFTETRAGLRGRISYRKGLFHAAAIRRMAAHLETLLQDACARPETPILALQLVTPEEEREVQSWEGKEVEYPREKSVGEVFEEVVREYGEKVAVVYEGEEVRYEELNRRANQVGRYLRKRGVRRETRVGVCMGRSVEMIVVLVGIVKAGGAYVPLDGSNPGERLSYMMKDGGVEVLVVGEEEEGRVEEGEYEKVVWERERGRWRERG